MAVSSWPVMGAVVLQLGVLAGTIASDAAPLVFGETIRLKVIPVDPRDLFRGDYVVLGYDHSRLEWRQFDAEFSRTGWYDFSKDVGREVYVSLRPSADGAYLRANKMGLKRPASGPYLRGQIDDRGRASFGIEAWYVQEGEGHNLESALRGGRTVYADVAVWRGTARLKNVVVE